jgi:iron(III) transport system substrate-binding protein
LAQPFDLAAAKKEGKVVWYCSVPIETAQKIGNMFEQKTGIKVELFRSGGTAILRRFQQEADGGRVFVDVLTHSEPAAARMMTKKGRSRRPISTRCRTASRTQTAITSRSG